MAPTAVFQNKKDYLENLMVTKNTRVGEVFVILSVPHFQQPSPSY